MERKTLVEEFSRVLDRFHRVRPFARIDGFSKGEFLVLEVLYRTRELQPDGKGVYSSALADMLEMAPSAVSRLARGMEAKGLIERSVDPDDRRNTFILLTDKGETVCLRVRRTMDRYLVGIMQRMGEDKLRQLLALWSELADVMETESEKISEGER